MSYPSCNAGDDSVLSTPGSRCEIIWNFNGRRNSRAAAIAPTTYAMTGEGDCGSEPVGPAANRKPSGHATAPNRGSVAGRVHVTCKGIGPLGSQGCSATA